jgi:serine kinase of HPr protein (carbohydrate metabolism regulator)
MLREAGTGAATDAGAHARSAAPRARAELHASCVALGGQGVVLRGPSASGKSDLALRLIDAGATLVADDRLLVERRGGQLIGRAPAALAGLLEVRGLGIMRVEHCAAAPLGLVVELGEAAAWPRLPEPMTHELLGVALPCVRLDPRAPSSCAKIKLALAAERIA